VSFGLVPRSRAGITDRTTRSLPLPTESVGDYSWSFCSGGRAGSIECTPPRLRLSVNISTFREEPVPVSRVIRRASIPIDAHINEDSHNGRRQNVPFGSARSLRRVHTSPVVRGHVVCLLTVKTLGRRTNHPKFSEGVYFHCVGWNSEAFRIRWISRTSSTVYRVSIQGSATFEYPRTSQNPGSSFSTNRSPRSHFALL
jgi:hypothetical protein